MLRFRFSVRVLLALTTVVAAVCLYIAQWNRIRFAEQQLCAIATPFDPNVNGYSEDSLFGVDDNFTPLRGLLVRCELNDVEKYLVDANSLEELEFVGIELDASRLSRVVGELPRLKRLTLRECRIVASKTACLRSATLACIEIGDADFQDHGRMTFDCPALTSLDIYDSSIRSLSAFHACSAIRELFISDSTGVAPVEPERGRFPNLRRYLLNGELQVWP